MKEIHFIFFFSLVSFVLGGLIAFFIQEIFNFFIKLRRLKKEPFEKKVKRIEARLDEISDKVFQHQESINQIFLSRGNRK